jgi:glycosyltransferase involved in cell wall biosynthesis
VSEFPEVSVVMGVYDGAAHLAETIDSVLSQRDVKFELVVVDDGSTDATPAILELYASHDARVRVRRQGRLGLTRALIAGCAAARAPVIARQDCGDVSLPGRLARQLDRLRSTRGTSLVSAGAEFVGPRGEWLYAVQDTDATLKAGLARTSMAMTRGPSHHGATMFSRAAYEAVGGYRAAFAVAQDLDLWMRLWERGGVLAAPEVLYRARLHPRSLSATRRPEQVAYTRVIIAGASARRDGRRDDSVEAAERLTASRRHRKPEATAASYSYFLARVLEASQPEIAKQYLGEALRENPLLARAWIALARLLARRWRPRWQRQLAP